ncbi:phage antirepressor KilAC domain-containing protein [Streptomyces sp. NBC_00433]
MSNIIPFTFPETGQPVRVIGDHDEPLFHHGDVCKVLQHTNPTVAARMLDGDESRMVDMRGIAAGQTALSEFRAPATGNAEARFVTEPGLYTLVFSSKAPGAPAFRRWLTHEVIPQIRRTGSYSAAPAVLSNRDLARMVLEEADRADAAEAKVAELEPAAASWNVLATAAGDFSVGDAAKILSRDPSIKTGERRLFTVLAENKWTYRQVSDDRPRAMQTAIEAGRLSELPQSHYHPRTGELVLDAPQVRVTVKGLNELHKRLGGTGAVQVPAVTS